MKRNKRRKTKKNDFQVPPRIVWGIVIGCILLGGVLYLARLVPVTSWFRIDEVTSNIELDKNFQRMVMGQSLFTVDTKKLYDRIKREHPEYKSITIIKEFPSRLDVRVIKRKPFAQWRNKYFFPLDRDGIVIATGRARPHDGLVTVEIAGKEIGLQRGSHIADGRLKAAFSLLDALQKRRFLASFPVRSINATNLKTMYFLVGDTEVIVGEDKFERKLGLFENFLDEKLGGDLSAVKYIDLRYKKIYLGYRR